MNPYFSIIVPVYNTQQFLSECLNSLINQSFRDWECIILNDGSSDNSAHICDEYGRKDSRFVVIHQRNKGQSATRNRGLDCAQGEWIVFLDSDDYLDISFCQNMYNYSKKYQGVDLFSFGMKRFFDKTIISDKKYKSEQVISSLDLIRGWDFTHAGCSYMWNCKTIEKTHLRFIDGFTFCEDQELLSRIFLHDPKIVLLPYSPYYYRKNSSSITSQKQISLTWCESYLFAATNLWKYAKANNLTNSEVLPYLLSDFYDQFIFYMYENINFDKKLGYQKYAKYYDSLCSEYVYFRSIKRFRYYRFSERLFHLFSNKYNRFWIRFNMIKNKAKKIVYYIIFRDRNISNYRINL